MAVTWKESANAGLGAAEQLPFPFNFDKFNNIDSMSKNDPIMNDRWLKVSEICEYMNISNETIYKWIERQGMPGHRVGRRWMFKKDEVDAWVRKGGANEGRSDE